MVLLMAKMNLLKQVAMQRKRIILDLLPDTCKIYPKVGANPHIVKGVLTSDPPVARQYKGSEIIPCRSDLSRAFRPDKLKMQATEVDEYNLELPADCIVEPSDLVHLTNPTTLQTEIFEIRKRKNVSLFDGTIECIIAVPGVNVDAHS